jgi:hypothetical protein
MVRILAILFAVYLTAPTTHAAEVSLSVEPPVAVANESIRLIFSADGSVDVEPTFNELNGVVDILGRNRQTSIQWINGKNTQSTTWILDVIALSPGQISIPSVRFGNDSSRPLVVEVSSGNTSNVAAVESELILEIETDNAAPYVQEQIILTARLLRRIELNDAKMTEPSTDSDAIIKRLGTDSTYQTVRNGKRYEVFERLYSIFPQSSGPVNIAPLTLTTQIVRASQRIFSPFRQKVKTRRIESNSITLDVKPIPATYTGDAWLPARRLELRDEWTPDTDAIQSGEPLTRTVYLWADGLNAGQLPQISIQLPSGLKSYPDQPQTSEQETATGFSAIRQQNYAMIPTAAGAMVFPEISIKWWNTQTDRAEVAHLGVREFTVEGGALPDPVQPTLAGDVPASTTTVLAAENQQAQAIALEYDRSYANRYLVPLVLCAIGWLVTGCAWWWSRRNRHQRQAAAKTNEFNAPPRLAQARRDVLDACKANDPRASKSALIAWSRVAFSRVEINSLGEISKLVGVPLNQEVRSLDEHLYGKSGQTWDHFSLREAFEHTEIPDQNGGELKHRVSALPDLHRLAPR